MFDWRRLSREDYVMFGGCGIIELSDIAHFFASFEAEESGVFGDNLDLMEIERIIVLGKEYSEITHKYNDLWIKWKDYAVSAIASGNVNYANVLRKGEGEEPLEEGEIRYYMGVCAINAKDFWDYLSEDADRGGLKLDIDILIEYLRGNGSAPSLSQTTKEVTVEVVKEVEVMPKGYHKQLAVKKYDKTKPLQESLFKFLEDDLAGDCTCTKRQASDRIYRGKYKGDERLLKRETGYGYLSFTRQVSAALKRLDADKDINRHENTEGFSFDKLPKVCAKHHKK